MLNFFISKIKKRTVVVVFQLCHGENRFVLGGLAYGV